MPRRCALGCPPNKRGLLHIVPNPDKYPEQHKAWLKIIPGNQDPDFDYKKYRVCDRHFTNEDRTRSSRLNVLAVPSLFLPHSTAHTQLLANSNNEGLPMTTESQDHATGLRVEALTTNKEKYLSSEEKAIKTKERSPPASASIGIDYVEGSICTTEEEVFEFDPEEDFVLNDATSVTISTNLTNNTIDKPFETANDNQDVVMIEISAEREVGRSDTIPRVTRDTCRADQPCTDDTKTPHDTQAADKENNSYTNYWKSKLTHILHSTQFCGICLCTDDTVHSFNDQFDIVVCDNTHTTTLADILHVVFRETENLLSNAKICNKCTNKLIKSYMFIQQTRETSKILNCHIQDLYNKSCYIYNSVLKETEQERSQNENVLITLENYENSNHLCNIYTMGQMRKVETNPDRPKRRRQRRKCRLYLPSEMIHEISTHSSKALSHIQSNLSTSDELAKARKCQICYRIVPYSSFNEYLKKYHEIPTRVCSICYITFDSYKALVTHKQELHYKVDR